MKHNHLTHGIPSRRILGTSLACVSWLYLVFAIGIQSSAQEVAESAVDFEKEIRPILQKHCFDCHGEDGQESGFRADNRWDLLKGGDSGESGIVPGHPDKSFVVKAITTDDQDFLMPQGGDRLPKKQIELIKRWIREGANWPGQMHTQEAEEVTLWSMQPVANPAVPEAIKDQVQHNEIDQFVQHALKSKGLNSSASATPRNLIRRLSVILTGLYPLPEQVAEFEKDYQENPNATYESAVDRLLASPHFGERWAQHWLDVIRWGETTGGEANLYRKNAWPYRDYLITAFNDDLPYDQFVKEQLAGDVLGAPMATGFLVAGPNIPKDSLGDQVMDHKIARSNRLDQTIQTVSASILGLTVSCARCHNHKFDPISIEDYYSMKAVFEDLEYEPRIPELRENHPRVLADRKLRGEIDALRVKLNGSSWIEDWETWQQVHFPKVTTKKVRITFYSTYVTLDELEILDSSGRNLLLYEDFDLTAIDQGRLPNRPNKSLIDGAYGAWRSFNVFLRKPDEQQEKPWIEIAFNDPHEISTIRFSEDREFFELSDFADKNRPRPVKNYTVKMDQNGKMAAVANWFDFQKSMKNDSERKFVIDQIQEKIAALKERGLHPLFIGNFVKKQDVRIDRRGWEELSSATGYKSSLSFPEETHVFKRGDVDSLGDLVEPAGISAIHGGLNLETSYASPERRVEFGKWLAAKSHPLTARVMVNRIWHHVFGRGLVVTGSDFGNAGAPSDHPELLDWLAHEFMSPQDGGKQWSTKRMIRQMVMSHAFRQSSRPDAESAAIDSGSIYLWRHNPRRVEAEVIRDNILTITGRLNPQIGGRGYNIYGPKLKYGHWHMEDNHSEFTWRRLIYQDKMRRTDDELFAVFDLPDCGQIRDKRAISTTPLQALNLLNSEFMVSQAEYLAADLEKQSSDPATQINRCFELLFGRRPSPVELKTCLAIANDEGLTVICRALFNSNEFSLLQ